MSRFIGFIIAFSPRKDSVPWIPLGLGINPRIIPSFPKEDRGHHLHGYSQSRLGCFNGSLYIFPFTRSMGKEWTLTFRVL